MFQASIGSAHVKRQKELHSFACRSVASAAESVQSYHLAQISSSEASPPESVTPAVGSDNNDSQAHLVPLLLIRSRRVCLLFMHLMSCGSAL